MKIELVPFKQEKSHTCMPAAIRAVLHSFGIEFSEAQIARACHTNKRGTNLDQAVEGMEALGFEVIQFEESDLPELIVYLEKNIPVIVALDVSYLPYGDMGLHAVVLNGLQANKVSFVDPALGKIVSISLLDFYKAWNSRGRSGLVVYPKQK